MFTVGVQGAVQRWCSWTPTGNLYVDTKLASHNDYLMRVVVVPYQSGVSVG